MTAGDDYETDPYTVRFSAGQQNATLMVSTMEDNITELTEYFKVVINSTNQPGAVGIGSPSTAFITIEDNDPGVYEHADSVSDACILWFCFCRVNIECMHACVHEYNSSVGRVKV